MITFWQRPVWDCLVPAAIREMDENMDYSIGKHDDDNSLAATTVSSISQTSVNDSRSTDPFAPTKETLAIFDKPDNETVSTYAWSCFACSESTVDDFEESSSLKENEKRSRPMKSKTSTSKSKTSKTENVKSDNASVKNKNHTWPIFASLFGQRGQQEEETPKVLPPLAFFEVHGIPHPPTDGSATFDDQWLPSPPSINLDYPLVV